MLLWISSVLGEEQEPYKSCSIQTLGLQVRRFSWNAKRMQREYTFDLETHRYIASLLDLRITRTRIQSLERTISSLQIMHRRSIIIIKCEQQSPWWWSSSSRVQPKIYNIQSSTFHVFNNKQVLQESHFNSIFITNLSLSLSLSLFLSLSIHLNGIFQIWLWSYLEIFNTRC
jgi:hypothetical protein